MKQPPDLPPFQPGPKPEKSDDGYQVFAEVVGGVPSFRKKDNLYQAAAVLVTSAIGAGVGFLMNGGFGAVLGLGAGLAVGGLGSGAVLMVLGWVRVFKRRK